MGKVLAGAEGFCGACGTAAAAAREATGTVLRSGVGMHVTLTQWLLLTDR